MRDSRYPNVEFLQAWADEADFHTKTVRVEECVAFETQGKSRTGSRYEHHTAHEERQEKAQKDRAGRMLDVRYDKLVIAVGCYNQTFGTPGVKENAFFLKDIGDARRIRQRLLECFEMASLPTTPDEVRRTLLHFAVVGGGPTGMTFAAELSDLVHGDMSRLYPDLRRWVRLSVYDVAPTILSMFDESLNEYALKTFRRQQIEIKTSHHVKELRTGLPSRDRHLEDDVVGSGGCFTLDTEEEGETGVGLCVWTTGNMMNPFVQRALEKCYVYPSTSATVTESSSQQGGTLDEEKLGLDQEEWQVDKDAKTGALMVDDHLRVQLHTKVPEKKKQQQDPTNNDEDEPSEPRPKLRAMVTDVFALGDNSMLRSGALPPTAQTANQQAVWLGKHLNAGDVQRCRGFSFKDMGVVAYLGDSKGLAQGGGSGKVSGRTAWLIWAGAWLNMSVSWRNRILIVMYWVLNRVFGRDISRF